jgi:mono/diheme cytochrome c family protein
MERAAFKGFMIVYLIIGFNVSGWAQDGDAGKTEFESSCAACHGPDGKGNGPLAAELKTKPADLTVLAKKNGGVFPLNSVFDTIYGLKLIIAHGTRDMPIWGYRYAPGLNEASAPSATDRFTRRSYEPDAVVRTRILAVIDYLNRIQQK